MITCDLTQRLPHRLRRVLLSWRRETQQAVPIDVSNPTSVTQLSSGTTATTTTITRILSALDSKSNNRKKKVLTMNNVIVIRQLPTYINIEEFKKFLATLPGLDRVLRARNIDSEGHLLMFLVFQNGSSIPELPNCINIDDESYSVARLDAEYDKNRFETAIDLFERIPIQPAALDPRCYAFTLIQGAMPPPTCHYCGEMVYNDHYITPCLRCSNVICRDCLYRNFEVALRDHEAMPVKCCDQVIHVDVTGNLLTEEQRAKYKDRYEEMCSKTPFYCAAYRCSAFIPPRKLRIEKNAVTCKNCGTQTCYHCRHEYTSDHVCSEATAEEDQFLGKFGYKRCPQCRAGQARMFGCSHMRCSCGTHWCWDCEVVTSLCYCCSNLAEDESDSEGTVWDASDVDDDDDNQETCGSPASPIDDHSEQIDKESGSKMDDEGILDSTPVAWKNGHTETKEDDHQQNVVATSEAGGQPDAERSEQTTVADIETNMDANEIRHEHHSTTTPDVETPDVDIHITTNESSEPTQIVTANQAASQVTARNDNTEFNNLDLYDDSRETNDDEVNFGEDPGDRWHCDPWDCPHKRRDINRTSIPKYWMNMVDPAWRDLDDSGKWERTLDCMICQRSMKITLPDEPVPRRQTAGVCASCGTLYCGRCADRIDRGRHRRRK